MAKSNQNIPQEEIEKKETQSIDVAEFVETKNTVTRTPILRRGEVLVAELDESGNEISEFISNQKTFDDFYSKNQKFKLKKK